MDYDDAHRRFLERVEQVHNRLAIWRPSSFHRIVIAGQGVFELRTPAVSSANATTTSAVNARTRAGDAVTRRRRLIAAPMDATASSLQKADKQRLQNYGRPYENDKPSGEYYAFMKNADEVVDFVE